MKTDDAISNLFFADAQKHLNVYLPRIVSCLRELGENDIWWRPNAASNSAGNLVLHLCGNMRQWIISGLGGAQDVRQRDLEFSEHGPIPRRMLITQLQKTVGESIQVLRELQPAALSRKYWIQGFHVTGLEAVSQVTTHFSYHAGQIIYLSKLKRGRDLHFTKLPTLKKRNS